MRASLALVAAAALLAGFPSLAAADESVEAGRALFVKRCQTCHGGTGPADSPIGPDLRGIIGRKAGAAGPGMHSRAAVESDLIWDRESLRRFLSAPAKELPGTLMPARVSDPEELDDLLNYLGTLR